MGAEGIVVIPEMTSDHRLDGLAGGDATREEFTRLDWLFGDCWSGGSGSNKMRASTYKPPQNAWELLVRRRGGELYFPGARPPAPNLVGATLFSPPLRRKERWS